MHQLDCGRGCTFVKSTAEVGAAVTLILTSGAGFSSGCVLTALAPNTQLSVATFLIFSAGLRTRKEKAASAIRNVTHTHAGELSHEHLYTGFPKCHFKDMRRSQYFSFPSRTSSGFLPVSLLLCIAFHLTPLRLLRVCVRPHTNTRPEHVPSFCMILTKDSTYICGQAAVQ